MEVMSVLEAVQKGMKDNIYNFCKDGKCSQCGNCCSNLLPMSRKEVAAIRRYIRKNHIKECKHLLPTANRTYDMTCPFLIRIRVARNAESIRFDQKFASNLSVTMSREQSTIGHCWDRRDRLLM